MSEIKKLNGGYLALGGVIAGAAAFAGVSELGVTPYARPDIQAVAQSEAAIQDTEAEVARLTAGLAERNENIDMLNATIDSLEGALEEARAAEAAPPENDEAVAERDTEIERLQALLDERDATIEERDAALVEREAEIAAIAERLSSPDTPPEVAEALAAVLEEPGPESAPIEPVGLDSDSTDIAAQEAALSTASKPPAPDLGEISEDLALVDAALAAAKDVPSVNGPPSPPADDALAQIHFETASARLTPGGVIGALEAVRAIKELGLEQIEVLGFTDTVGASDFNKRLAAERAQAVADVLIEAGLSQEMIVVAGLGEMGAPISTPDNTAEPLNRCVGVFPYLPETAIQN